MVLSKCLYDEDGLNVGKQSGLSSCNIICPNSHNGSLNTNAVSKPYQSSWLWPASWGEGVSCVVEFAASLSELAVSPASSCGSWRSCSEKYICVGLRRPQKTHCLESVVANGVLRHEGLPHIKFPLNTILNFPYPGVAAFTFYAWWWQQCASGHIWSKTIKTMYICNEKDKNWSASKSIMWWTASKSYRYSL